MAQRIKTILRRALMVYKRWRYGLKHAHPTFYMVGRSVVAKDFKAGPYSFINVDCWIGANVEIGPYVMFGPRVAVVGADHRMDVPGQPMIFASRPQCGLTVIEADAWIGYGTIILAGTRIGRGAVVGAGSVVTRDVPPYEVHAGVPARKISERFPDPDQRAIHERMLEQSPRQGQYARNR
jgi:acetyltransferase-like isoleucine patch superfamily enzyme